MGKVTGFMEFKRVDESYTEVDQRLKNYKEFTIPLKEKELKNQGARCMDLWYSILSQWVSIG